MRDHLRVSRTPCDQCFGAFLLLLCGWVLGVQATPKEAHNSFEASPFAKDLQEVEQGYHNADILHFLLSDPGDSSLGPPQNAQELVMITFGSQEFSS